MDNVVELAGVSRRYGARGGSMLALRDVWLAVPAGTFVAVMGATRSGKSTLLHCAAGLDRPTSGTVRLAGQDGQPIMAVCGRSRTGVGGPTVRAQRW